MDYVAAEFAGEVDVIAVAWASTYEKTASAARGFLNRGATRWLLDEDDSVFAAFEVTYQPVGVFVVGGVEVKRWFGSLPEQELRQAFTDALA
ncbi:MAG: hypothetical protein OXD34_10060 [bacterium]|nr:hypothetical protein [bacterium]